MSEMKEWTPLELLKSNLKGKRDLALAYRKDSERYAQMAVTADREAEQYERAIEKLERN